MSVPLIAISNQHLRCCLLLALSSSHCSTIIPKIRQHIRCKFFGRVGVKQMNRVIDRPKFPCSGSPRKTPPQLQWCFIFTISLFVSTTGHLLLTLSNSYPASSRSILCPQIPHLILAYFSHVPRHSHSVAQMGHQLSVLRITCPVQLHLIFITLARISSAQACFFLPMTLICCPEALLSHPSFHDSLG